ncbi:MAG: KH domain-containing protein [Bacilli bacterium]|nr:KH domain-containing protein [Bacilli bacterium]
MSNNIDYKSIIHTFVDDISNNPDNIGISVKEEEKNVNIDISADNDDIARLIGKEGRVANSLREIMGVLGKDNEKFIHVHFIERNKIETK